MVGANVKFLIKRSAILEIIFKKSVNSDLATLFFKC